MSNATRDFLIRLGEDPETLERFRKDPNAVMNEHDVPEDHQALILADDREALKKKAGIDDEQARFIIV